MIIVKLSGGLGNQMFQYAAAKSLAIRNNTQLKIDITRLLNSPARDTKREYELNIYNIDDQLATNIEVDKMVGTKYNFRYFKRKLIDKIMPFSKGTYIKERSFCFDPRVITLGDNILLDGAWASEKYFSDTEGDIRKIFKLRKKPSPKTVEVWNQIAKVNSVSIHIRRGDYITNPHAKVFHGVCSMEYYQQAMELISDKIKNPHFFIFSDDLPWAKENFGQNSTLTYVEHNLGIANHEDMLLMSACKHNIIANSTFSWWGAWLNQNSNKIVISPKQWYLANKLDIKDLLPESWIKI
ncbi:MAG: alpha-1,2-fucosyltransferase [Pelosinus sp.]|nr:alpha-1,2-fucosyltransferase [Pelosinus sp.]